MRLEARRSCRPRAPCPCAPRRARGRAFPRRARPRSDARARRCGRCARAPRASRRSRRPATFAGRLPQHRMRDARGLAAVAMAKPAAIAASRARAESRPARRRATNGDRDAGERQRRGRPPGRFALGGEIERRCRSRRRPAARAPAGRARPRRAPIATAGGAAARGASASPSGSVRPARRRAALEIPGFGARPRPSSWAFGRAMARRPQTLTQPEGLRCYLSHRLWLGERL